MTNEVLITHIGYLYDKHKKYGIKIIAKLNKGASCKQEEQNLINAAFFIQELEKYYNNCSCLEEDDICSFIKTTKTLLN